MPSLLLFLLLGMLGGEDGLGCQFASYETAESLCHFAVTIILFDAGLKTSLRETRPVFRQGVLLSSLGVILTVLLTGLFIAVAFGGDQKMPLIGALLLAAILGSTDSATVFSLLHGKRLHLREHLAPMLELYLRRSLMRTEGAWLPILRSPIAALCIIGTLILVIFTVRGELKKAKAKAAA